jgi:hypothetical protein
MGAQMSVGIDMCHGFLVRLAEIILQAAFVCMHKPRVQEHATVRVWKSEDDWRLQAPSRLWGDTSVTLAAT